MRLISLFAFVLTITPLHVAAQTTLAPFTGSTPDKKAIQDVCNARIETSTPGYLPFCHNVIVTHFGDEEFRKFYEGESLSAFLTRSQAQAFEAQTSRVAALAGGNFSCLGQTLDYCLAAVGTSLFVTSAPSEAKWVPSERLFETQYVHFQAYKLPVYDELRRLNRQWQNEISVILSVIPGELVQSFGVRIKVSDPSLSQLLKSGLPEILMAAVPSCKSGGSAIVQSAIQSILKMEMSEGEDGQSAAGNLKLCGNLASVFRFQPKMVGLETSPEHINVTFRSSKQ